MWRRNFASAALLADNVLDVLGDQSWRGQVLKFTETETRVKFTGFVPTLPWRHQEQEGQAERCRDGPCPRQWNPWYRSTIGRGCETQ